MLNIIIFLPVIAGLIILLLPRGRPDLIRGAALAAAAITLALTIALWAGYDPAQGWETRVDWIPSIGASYHVAVDGLSLPLIALAALLMATVMVYVLPKKHRAKEHAFLFLLMETGLLGLFASRDLLLFYLFFELGLVPMYFIIGIWGHEERRYAAVKFFLYTRAGSLAMLLAFLGLYLAASPHTFSLPALIAAQPLAGRPLAASLAFFGMLLGFGVKIPTVPIHNWLPDAHVEAPTEGSVILAGIQLKMGGYGLLRVLLPTLPEAVQRHATLLLILAVASLIYGALAALAQKDFKRLIAYTSINHMGYVMLAAGIWGLTADPEIRQLALNGAVLQMVSHGLLTGGAFFMVGILQDKLQTRQLDRLGGLLGPMPYYSGLLGVIAFASLGLPGFSGFIAEFEVIGGAVGVELWAAALTVLGLIIVTGVYLQVVLSIILGEAPAGMPPLADLDLRQAVAVGALTLLSLLIGIFPAWILGLIESGTALLAATGG